MERPKECRGCRKRLNVKYRCVVHGQLHEMCACSNCPAIAGKVHGSIQSARCEDGDEENGLMCSGCGTHLSDIRGGALLGCSECYTTFADYIDSYLTSCQRVKKGEKGVIKTLEGTSLHIGKTPFETTDATLTSRLCDLNDALNEALKIENYEQAAWLRDRIKTLTEAKSDGAEQAS